MFTLEKGENSTAFILIVSTTGDRYTVTVDPEKGFVGLPLEFQHNMRQFKKEDILDHPQAVLEGVL